MNYEPIHDPADPRDIRHTPQTDANAEATVLCAAMDDHAHARDILAGMTVLDFAASEEHAGIARVIFALIEDGHTPDAVAVAGRGAHPHVVFSAMASTAHVPGARRIVREQTQRRGLRTLARRLIADAEDAATSPRETVVATETALQTLGAQAGDVAVVDAQAGIPAALDAIEAYGKGQARLGLQTGLADLDEKITGLRAGELVLVAGRPGQGKTTLACQVARGAALAGHAVLIAAYETSAAQLYENALCAEAAVDAHRARSGRLAEVDWHGLTMASERLGKAPLWICDDRRADVSDIRRVAQRIAVQRPLGLVVVDYIQLVPALGHAQNREQEVASVSRTLKALAGELNCPIVALSQLNRGVEQRQEGEPRLADLRESGALEQDADAVILIHRPSREGQEVKLIVAKQRHGPIGTVSVAFLRDRLRFERFSAEDAPPPNERFPR